MINAGVKILASYGKASFNTLTGIWEGVEITITYPEGQTVYANPVGIGDIITENIGNLWKVVECELIDVGDRIFRVHLIQLNAEPHPDVSPEFLLTDGGSISTPIKGALNPYWNGQVVDAQVYRRAMSFNIEQSKLVGEGFLKTINGESLLGVGDISVLTRVTKADVGLELVKNKDQTDASNLTKGLVPDNRLSENILRGYREVIAGDGLVGGGEIKNNPHVSLGTPLTITGTSFNAVGEENHSHALDINRSDIGLENVDNTSDLAKPISHLVQQALDGKQDKLESRISIKTINNQSLLGSGNLNVSTFNEGGDYLNLRARATTKVDVELGNVPNINATHADHIVTGTLNDARLPNSVVRTERRIIAGNGLVGGGDLGSNRVITLGIPEEINDLSDNLLRENSHTHKLVISKHSVGLSNVDNTSDRHKPISELTQGALDTKQETLVSGVNIATINHQSLLNAFNFDIPIFNQFGDYEGLRARATMKEDVGLGNVDNTNDANKPVSDATQIALNEKQDLLTRDHLLGKINGVLFHYQSDICLDFPGDIFDKEGTYPLLRAQSTTKSDVGLSNVDNTSDLAKPISIATQSALNTKQSTLVSGTNIKTVNNKNLLGSGNVHIEVGEIINAGTYLGRINGTAFHFQESISIDAGDGGGVTYTAGEGISISNNVITNTAMGGGDTGGGGITLDYVHKNRLGIKTGILGKARSLGYNSGGWESGEWKDVNGQSVSKSENFPHQESNYPSTHPNATDNTSTIISCSYRVTTEQSETDRWNTYTHPINSCVLTSSGCKTHAGYSTIFSSKGSFVNRGMSFVGGSLNGYARAYNSAVICSQESANEPQAEFSTVIASRLTTTDKEYTLVMGHQNHNPSGGTLAGRKIELDGKVGRITLAQNVVSGGFDFAEYFENGEEKEIEAGFIITNKKGKVYKAQLGDPIDGVVSYTAAIMGNMDSFSWYNRYERDEFGKPIYCLKEDPSYRTYIDNPNWKPGEPESIKNPEPPKMVSVMKENPDWNPELEQVDRSLRPNEWTPVGLLGQVYVRVSSGVVEQSSIEPNNEGIGIPTDRKTGLRAMKLTTPFDPEKGYAVALCLINIHV